MPQSSGVRDLPPKGDSTSTRPYPAARSAFSALVGSRRRCIGVADAVGEATGTAGGDGVHQVDPAVAVEHDRFAGMGIDRRDEHRSFRPALTGQPSGDGGAPPRLPEPSDAASISSAAAPILRRMSAASSAEAMIRLVLSMWSATGPIGNASAGRIRPDRSVAGGAAARMSASSSAGVAPAIWAAAVDPADVPMIRSACVTSNPASTQAGDDADQPRIACRSATAEDQRCVGGVFRDVVRGRLRVVLK